MFFQGLLLSVVENYRKQSSSGYVLCPGLTGESTVNLVVDGPTILHRITNFDQGKCLRICSFFTIQRREMCWNYDTRTCDIPKHCIRITNRSWNLRRSNEYEIHSFQVQNKVHCDHLCRLTPGCKFWNYHHKFNIPTNGYCSLVADQVHGFPDLLILRFKEMIEISGQPC